MHMLKALSNYLQDEGRQPNTDLGNLWMHKSLKLEKQFKTVSVNMTGTQIWSKLSEV